MVIWLPGQRQFYGNNQSRYCHSWIHCDGRIVEKLLRANHLPTNEAFAVSPTLIEQTLLAIDEELTSPQPADEKIVIAMLELLGSANIQAPATGKPSSHRS